MKNEFLSLGSWISESRFGYPPKGPSAALRLAQGRLNECCTSFPCHAELVEASGVLHPGISEQPVKKLRYILSLADKEDRRVSTLKEFLSMSIPYVLVSLVACYIPAMIIWVLPFAK
jgi:hypothetical protein